MEYEIRSMSNSRRISETLPRRGQVNEVCKEWLVHEDEALAYRLQKQEVDEHYTGNKFRNAQVREDFPKAKVEQQKELEEATSKYRQLKQQEETDSSYAKRIAEELKQREFRKQQLEVNDFEIARRTQRHEMDKMHPRSGQKNILKPDVNQVGLPLMKSVGYQSNDRHTSVALTHSLRKLKLDESINQNNNPSSPLDSVDNNDSISHTVASVAGPSYLADDNDAFAEEAERRLQEERDAELAKLLQEQEEEINQESRIDRDRLLAIEAQDKELAKLLQEKERAKLRRAREKAKQKALLRKQLQSSEIMVENENIVVDGQTADNPLLSSSGSRPHVTAHFSSDNDDNHSEDGGPPSINNVAMAIDPTFLYNRAENTASLCYLDGTAAPPYMPIQGQRRTTSLEKKQKKGKYKDGCKQQ